MRTKKLILKKEIKNLYKTIHMKCLECCCSQIKEVLLCDIPGCPLWELRPKEAKGLQALIKRLKQKNSDVSEAKK